MGTSIPQDICSLRKAGFDITHIAPVAAFLDTQKIARELYWQEDPSKNMSLKDVCIFMGFQPIESHNCGNNDAYTLVVLLGLASRILGSDTYESFEDSEEHLNEILFTRIRKFQVNYQYYKVEKNYNR